MPTASSLLTGPAATGASVRALQRELAQGRTRAALVRRLMASGWPEALAKSEVSMAAAGMRQPSISRAAVADRAPAAANQPQAPLQPAAPTEPPVDPHHTVNSVALADQRVQVLFSAGKQSCHLTVFDGLITEPEIEHLIELAKPRLRRSTVVADQQTLAVDARRTSENCFLPLGCDAIVAGLEARISALIGIPVPNGEGLQILHYAHAQQYKPHFDYFTPDTEFARRTLAASGNRVGTLILYLSDVEAGGSTYLPTLDVAVHPRRGLAMWFDYLPGGQVDPRSLHAGMPITSGEKWIATKWFRARPFVG